MKRRLFLFLSMVVVLSFLNGKTYLFIGDSITDGNWGSPSKYPCDTEERNLWDKNHILGHGYVEMIAGYLEGEYPKSQIEVINRGISGQTLFQISGRWERDVMNHNPDIITLLCGTNDIHYWLEGKPDNVCEFDFKGYENELDSLIKLTLERNPDVEIVLCTPFVGAAGWAGTAEDFPLRKAGVDSLSNITKGIAGRYFDDRVKLIDFNGLLNNLEKENGDTEYWIWDGIHPTTAMHYRMAKKWLEKNSPE